MICAGFEQTVSEPRSMAVKWLLWKGSICFSIQLHLELF